MNTKRDNSVYPKVSRAIQKGELQLGREWEQKKQNAQNAEKISGIYCLKSVLL